jgi:hypothetical protein
MTKPGLIRPNDARSPELIPFGRPAQRPWIAVLCLSCGLLITLQAWLVRFSMNPDGISYLDMADKLMHGDLSPLLHPYWSPLYPVLLAIVMKLFPGPAVEFQAAHLANWVSAMSALASFTFFLGQYFRVRAAVTGVPVQKMFYCRAAFAYVLFLWGVLEPIGLAAINPDLCVTALIYLAAGLCCRMPFIRPGTWITPAVLGIILGLACLTKAAMAPLGALLLVLLGIPWFSVPVRRSSLGIAILGFAVILGPYMFFMSRQQHRLTFGEAGRLNYAWLVQGGIPLHAGWMGQEPADGTPSHPPRMLSSDPPVLEFKGPVHATYPLWYDPAYFHEGLQVNFDFRKQISALAKSARTLPWAAGTSLYPLVAGLLVLAGFTSPRKIWINLSKCMLLIWSLAAFGTFALVTIEPRYVSPFLVLFWLTAYDAVSGGRLGATYRGVISVTAVCILLFQLHALGKMSVETMRAPMPPADIVVARELARLGLHPGDEIATVGSGFGAYYARLARLQIVANIGWTGDDTSNDVRTPELNDAQIQAVRAKLREIQIKAIVSRQNCVASLSTFWHSITDTGYCVVLLE